MDYEKEDLENLYADLVRRRQFVKMPKKMSQLVSSLLARKGYAQSFSADDCRAAWDAAAGERIAKQTRPGAIKRGVLEVYVSNSTAHQQLAFQKKKILKKLQQQAPDLKITELRFKVGEIK